ncbi:hypothetical protein [Pseudomonas asgharzadehiana]|uniref:hypothetical protein n=1 Tax=Pseudomonas asgharzadehiana TaxID=2842349 RepID=UPI001CEC12C2|nr:hypothetical protein [Pseudomonas asgharzadehiana]
MSAISPELNERLDTPCWYHGTKQNFESWTFPPPMKPGENLLVPHTAVFFTSNIEFARGAGEKIAIVSLNSNSRVLDATENYDDSERLRKAVMRNEIASRTLNVGRDYWHAGWKTGDVLRMAFTDPQLENNLNEMISNHSRRLNVSLKVASAIVGHNATRGLIELICITARNLGFDALYGHEVDRHSIAGKKIAQPWLAVLSKGVVSEPEWI